MGVAMIVSARRARRDIEVPLIAAGASASLSAIDVFYVLRRRISRVYLADAVVEAAFAAYWLRELMATFSEPKARTSGGK
jgi:hypothetical protein